MNSKNILTLNLLALSLFLSSCLVQTRTELAGKINQKPYSEPTTTAQKTAPQKQVKIQEWDRVNELEKQIQNLRSEIEVLQNQISQKTQNPEQPSFKSKKAYEEALFNFEKALKQIQSRLKKLEKTSRNTKKSKRKIASKKRTGNKKTVVKKTKSTKKTLRANSKLKTLTLAEKSFRNKKWSEAIEFYEIYRKTAKGSSYREATYRIAVSFSELGMEKEAKSFFKELVKKHTKTKEAQQARIKLKEFHQ